MIIQGVYSFKYITSLITNKNSITEYMKAKIAAGNRDYLD